MSNLNRIKIFLIKDSIDKEDHEIIKTQDNKLHTCDLIGDVSLKLYYKYTGGLSPRWYRNYLKQNDNKLKVNYASGLIFKKLAYKDTLKRFVISFGGAESMINTEYLEPRFGLKIALNLADKIFSISKNSISTTMARIRETAIQDQELSDFVFDLEEDLLKGIVVKPKKNTITESNIAGNIGLSISTEKSFDDIDFVLTQCMDYYNGEEYKTNYPFLDNMIELNPKSDLIMKIYDLILDSIKNKEIDKVWFAPLDDINWEVVESYSFYKYRISKNKRSTLDVVNSINFDTIYSYIIEDIDVINDLKILKKYKIIINSTNGEYSNKMWSFFDCMYASITLKDKHYVLNEGSVYEIKQEFYKDYEKSYQKLDIFPSLPTGLKSQTERDYLEVVCDLDPNLLLVDQKLVYRNRGSFEPCDIFKIDEKNFIHVKKYGSSKILSHLFAQAIVSADLFMNNSFKDDVIKNLNSICYDDSFKYLTYSDCIVTMAIITEKEIPSDGLLKIPFFSMVNVVRTVEQIKNWGYKNVGLMFIEAK